jgi:hypothetical protein
MEIKNNQKMNTKKKLMLACLFFIFLSPIFAQQITDEEAVRKIAENILAQPVTQFVGVDNGVIYNSTEEIPEGIEVKFRSPLAEWHYSNGVLDMAMIRLGKYLNFPIRVRKEVPIYASSAQTVILRGNVRQSVPSGNRSCLFMIWSAALSI